MLDFSYIVANTVSGTINNVFEAETNADAPEIIPSLSGQTQSYVQAIQFRWENPPKTGENCHLQNGIGDGHLVALYALDPWAKKDAKNEPIETEPIPENVDSFYVHQLKPFTNYELLVFR